MRPASYFKYKDLGDGKGNSNQTQSNNQSNNSQNNKETSNNDKQESKQEGKQGDVKNSITDIISEEQKNSLLLKNKICIIYYHASWCMPCVSAAPKYKLLSGKYNPNVCFFAKEDVDLKLTTNI